MTALIHFFELDGDSRERQYREWVRQRLDGECSYCGRKPKFLTIDHIIPTSKGGGWDACNLAPACSRCNDSKAAHDVWQWWHRQPFWDESRGDRLRQLMEE